MCAVQGEGTAGPGGQRSPDWTRLRPHSPAVVVPLHLLSCLRLWAQDSQQELWPSRAWLHQAAAPPAVAPGAAQGSQDPCSGSWDVPRSGQNGQSCRQSAHPPSSRSVTPEDMSWDPPHRASCPWERLRAPLSTPRPDCCCHPPVSRQTSSPGRQERAAPCPPETPGALAADTGHRHFRRDGPRITPLFLPSLVSLERFCMKQRS